jgi:hypothetical protein
VTAREKFTVNETVQLTESGERPSRSLKQGQRGIVRGFGRQSWQVRVQLDGRRFVKNWHMHCWEKVTP